MITERIKALFEFIDFLHSNTENFKKYNGLMEEIISLNQHRWQLKPTENYRDKLKDDELSAEYSQKLGLIDANVVEPIKKEAIRLSVSKWDNYKVVWDYSYPEINDLKKNFTSNDITEIQMYQKKYVKFRTQTNSHYTMIGFFANLDGSLKKLFDFFKDQETNEFEAFESKPIVIENITDDIEQFKKDGSTAFSMPSSQRFKNIDSDDDNLDAADRQSGPQQPKGFDLGILNEYIIAKDIERFVAFEKELINLGGCFDEDKRWNRPKGELAALVSLLMGTGIFMATERAAKTKISTTTMARFFMSRYNCNFDKSLLGNKNNVAKATLRKELTADLYKYSLFR